MNSSLWLHVFQYCSFHDLLVNVLCTSKEWKLIMRSKAANVQLWMNMTDHAIRSYDCKKVLPMKYSEHPTARYTIDWFKECKTIFQYIIASNYTGLYGMMVENMPMTPFISTTTYARYMRTQMKPFAGHLITGTARNGLLSMNTHGSFFITLCPPHRSLFIILQKYSLSSTTLLRPFSGSTVKQGNGSVRYIKRGMILRVRHVMLGFHRHRYVGIG